MRKLFIAMIAGGFLLLSGVVASARFDSGSASQAPQIRAEGQANQSGNTNSQTTDKPTTTPTTPATKPSTTAPKPAATTVECGEQGDNTGDHQHEDAAACNSQNEQAGVNETTTANDTADQSGNSEG